MVKVCHFRKNNEILHCLFCFSFTLFSIPSPPHRSSLQKNSRQNANDAFFSHCRSPYPKGPRFGWLSLCGWVSPLFLGCLRVSFLQGVGFGGKMATLGVFFFFSIRKTSSARSLATRGGSHPEGSSKAEVN